MHSYYIEIESEEEYLNRINKIANKFVTSTPDFMCLQEMEV